MGFDTTRGSSSRGGKEALQEMIELANERNYCTGIAVDAPAALAKSQNRGSHAGERNGRPVLPLMSWATQADTVWIVGQHDSSPPLRTIVMAFGKPTIVPEGLTNDDYERFRQEIEGQHA